MRIAIVTCIIALLYSCKSDVAETLQINSKKSWPARIERVNSDQIQCDTATSFDSTKFIPYSVHWSIPVKYKRQATQIKMNPHAGFSFSNLPQDQINVEHSTRQVSTMDSTLARIPVRQPVGNLSSREHNPLGVTFLSKLHGLKHEQINCMIRDKEGRLWIGTRGGVMCYDGYALMSYSRPEGLICDEVYDITEDKNGGLWIATDEGPVFFDGSYFIRFRSETNLDKSAVLSVFTASDGAIWFGLMSGAASYHNHELVIYNASIGFTDEAITAIMEDSQHRMWFASMGGGCIIMQDFAIKKLLVDHGLSGLHVTSIALDNANRIWIGTPSGINLVSGDSLYDVYEFGLNPIANVQTFLHSADGDAWIGTRDRGILRISNDSLYHMPASDGLSDDFVVCLLEDEHDVLWVGTLEGGLNRCPNELFTHISKQDGLVHVNAVEEDASGQVWIGSDQGISRARDLGIEHAELSSGGIRIADPEVLDVSVGKSGEIWFATYGGALRYHNGEFSLLSAKAGLCNDYLLSILTDSQGRTWFGTISGLACYDGKHLLNYRFKNNYDFGLVFQIHEDHNGFIWFTTDQGIYQYTGFEFGRMQVDSPDLLKRIYSVAEDKTGVMWLGTLGKGLLRFDGGGVQVFDEHDGMNNTYIIALKEHNGELWIGSRIGLMHADIADLGRGTFTSGSMQNHDMGVENQAKFQHFGYSDGLVGLGVNFKALTLDSKERLWIGASDLLSIMDTRKIKWSSSTPVLEINSVDLFEERLQWRLLKANPDTTFFIGNHIPVLEVEMDDIQGWSQIPKGLSLNYADNYLSFHYNCNFLYQNENIIYRYKLEGFDADWSAITSQRFATFKNLPPGVYTFKVMAKAISGPWGDPVEFSFTIRPPFWKTWWAYLSYILIITIGFVLILRRRERSFMMRQRQLEIRVRQATESLRVQRAEAIRQKTYADDQRKLAEEQRVLIQQKNRETMDSIEYAKRLQNAILPPYRAIKSGLPDSFVLYQPKDVVAGDFYWFERMDDLILLAACDCTGHGVPGALVSIVCNGALNRAVNEFGLRDPARIFEKARELIVLNFAKSDEDVKDGMDASLCVIQYSEKRLLWSGANNPLWIYRKHSKAIEMIRPDKQTIGKVFEQKPFTTHCIDFEKGDVIYLFTDGYADQFGGPLNKKMTKAKFRAFLAGIAELPAERQRNLLLKFQADYMGDNEQVDDICIIGVIL